MHKNSIVSTIITTKNEAKNIGNCLRSIKNQTYLFHRNEVTLRDPEDRIEIIVVDNNSTDGTKGIAKRFTDKVYNFGPERSAQRNFGARKSNGKYLLFLDADFILQDTLIGECVDLMGKNDFVGLYIPLRWVGKNWIIRARGFEREFYDGTVLDTARIIKTTIFRRLNGFDNTLYAGEDWDLDKRLRKVGRIGIVKSKMYHFEDENINLRTFLKKINYYSCNLQIYINKWGKKDSDIRKQFGIFYRYISVFIENGRWKRLIKHPVLTSQMYVLKFLIGIVFLMNDFKGD